METGQGAEGPGVEGVQGPALEEGYCQKGVHHSGRQKVRSSSGHEIPEVEDELNGTIKEAEGVQENPNKA